MNSSVLFLTSVTLVNVVPGNARFPRTSLPQADIPGGEWTWPAHVVGLDAALRQLLPVSV
ncbi:MAG: hypothetical protein GY826_35820 [Fuerstiella sp.]|nr:hypothetical protein [Fuerstiella sp.]